MIYPVNNLDDVYNACHPDQPLEVIDSRYLDLTAVRSPRNIKVLSRRIARAQQQQKFHKQLFSGQRGSGKSTELHRLESILQHERYAVVFLNAAERIDLADICYLDILLILAAGVAETLEKIRIKLDDKIQADLKTWFVEHIIAHIYHKEELANILKLPFSRLLAELGSEVRIPCNRRVILRETLSNHTRGFIGKINELLIAARFNLQHQGFADLVIIVDGLEKMHYRLLADNETSFSHLFIRHASQLNALESHIIYTAPIALAFNGQLNSGLFILPMVKYQKPEAKQRLITLINQRISANLFTHEELINTLIDWSGGSMRDLFRLIQLATETANGQIKENDIKLAIKTLAKEYDRLIKSEFIPVLKEIADKKHIPVNDSDIYQQLLNLCLIHEYENGERWAEIHPVLFQISRLQDELSSPANLSTKDTKDTKNNSLNSVG